MLIFLEPPLSPPIKKPYNERKVSPYNINFNWTVYSQRGTSNIYVAKPIRFVSVSLLISLSVSSNEMQMPRGVPVATVAINNATNAGLLAVRMLGLVILTYRPGSRLSLFLFLSLFLCSMGKRRKVPCTDLVFVLLWAE